MIDYKKIFVGGLASVLILASFPTAFADNVNDTSASVKSTDNGESVSDWMPDTSLQSAVRKSLGLSDSATFSKSDLESITSISLTDVSVSSFTGLEYAKNLENVSLNNVKLPSNFVAANVLNKFSKLTSITATNLGLTSSMIGSLSLPNLQSIDISNNSLTNMDFGSSVNLPNLTYFDVSNNNLTDISGVTNNGGNFPKLKYWLGNNNHISDYSPLVGMQTDINNPAQGREQTIDKSVSLFKPVNTSSVYNLSNVVKTTGFNFENNTIIANDDSFTISSNNSDASNYNIGEYNLDNNTIPVIFNNDSNLPNTIEYNFSGSYGYETGLVSLNITWINLDVKDSTIYAGSSWKSSDNYVKSSQSVPFENVKVSGNVDTNKAGEYKVTYSYTDDGGNTVSKDAVIKVLASKASIDAKDSTLTAGPSAKWNASDNFVSATDQDGTAVDFKDIKVDGTVDTTKAGTYKVTYSYTDASGNVVSKEVTVTVKASNADANNNESSGNSTEAKNTTNSENHKQKQPVIQKVADAILPKTAAEKVGFSAILAIILAGVTGVVVFKIRRNKQ